jgi:hypothetical protein
MSDGDATAGSHPSEGLDPKDDAMSPEGAAPTRQDVQEELERILASKTFATHPALRKLLARLTKDTLDGQVGGKDYEYALGVEVFDKPVSWMPKEEAAVREAMRQLRKKLGAYYSAEGSGDKVAIDFPKRSGFAARFSDRPDNDAEDSVYRLTLAFWQTFPDIMRCRSIIGELKACIVKHPSYAPAYGVMAEAILACTMCDDTYGFPLPDALLRAEEAVKMGLSLHAEIWRLSLRQFQSGASPAFRQR